MVAWNSMKDDMIEVMVELKELRLERSTLEAAKARIDKARPVLQATEAKRHWADPNPNDADLFSMPEFADVFARPVLDDGTDTVTQEEINTALIALPNIVEGWTMRNKQYLANLLPRSSVKSRGKQAAAKEILRVDLANSFFRCSTCVNQGRRNYTCHSTTILHHRDWFYRANPDSRVSQAFGKVFGELTWNWNEGIAYDKEASAAATDIVTLCGLDPSTATLADMDRLNKRLICDGCQIVTRENEHQRRTYAWREAVSYDEFCSCAFTRVCFRWNTHAIVRSLISKSSTTRSPKKSCYSSTTTRYRHGTIIIDASTVPTALSDCLRTRLRT